MYLCQYRDILGVPRKGFHSLRIFDLAALDLIGTLGIAIILLYLYNELSIINIIMVFFLLWAIGTIFHVIFCVHTPITGLFGY